MDPDKHSETHEPEEAAAELVEVEESEDIAEQPESPDKDSPKDSHKKPAKRRHHQFKDWYVERKKWTIPASTVLLIILLAVIPWSRYHGAGLVLKKNMSLKVTDSTAYTPVSGALVSVGPISGITDGSGNVTLRHVKVGNQTAKITKKYYKDRSVSVLVPIGSQKQVPSVRFVATGRQVKVVATNLINNQGVAEANINFLNTDAKTDKNGEAVVVLPANASNQKVTLSADGYNDASIDLQVSGSEIKQNNVKLTPAGHVYFLSKLSGKIDVVKTNLDGTDRQTIVAGTGSEENQNTVLLASRDWRYLALLSKRDSGSAKLYIISTSDDKMIAMDQSDANFKLVGWQNHHFIYQLSRPNFQNWQSGATSIKSYNAETGQSLSLANSNASGSSNADAQYENIWDVLIVGDKVVYARTWYQYPGSFSVAGKQDVIASIHADGSGNSQIKAVDAATSYISNLTLNKPNELYFGVYNNASSDSSFYLLDKNSNVTSVSKIPGLDQETTSYLLSPLGDQTFWQDERDGKNTLFIGDQDAGAAKQIATLSDYSVYGWYSNSYLLVSKSASELYIMDNAGKLASKPIKISDYHKPAQTFYGYGGGYGGL